MSSPGTPSTSSKVPLTPSQALPLVLQPKLGGIVSRKYLWTGGRPLSNFLGTLQTVPRSPYCHHLQDPSEAHKQLKNKTLIHINDLESTKNFCKMRKN